MTDRFIAIGVNQGDAYFLQRGDFTALVDGGRSAEGFPSQFQRVVNRSSVEILICTHNDADHAEGILGFLKHGLDCSELWLPASWADRLEDVLLRPEDFTDELLQNIDQLKKPPLQEVDFERVSLLENLGDQYAEAEYNPKRVSESRLKEENLKYHIDTILGDISETKMNYWHSWFISFARLLRQWQLEPWRGELFIQALAAGERIRQISLKAFHRGIRIRWFKYSNNTSYGGIPNKMVPLNAQEVATIQLKQWSALMYLALTVSNRQSLVFYSQVSNNEPGILFTADSDLSFSEKIPWHSGMIITAPHHGSESNARAYERFKMETHQEIPTIWVRSDGRFRTRPGPSYLQVSPNRFCTLCRGSPHTKQNIRFMLYRGRWKSVATRKCNCK